MRRERERERGRERKGEEGGGWQRVINQYCNGLSFWVSGQEFTGTGTLFFIFIFIFIFLS